MNCRKIVSLVAVLLTCFSTLALAQVAGTSGGNNLVVVQGGATQATIVVAAGAGKWETQAGADLAKYIEMMSGAKPAIAAAAPAGNNPVFLVGSAALKAEPSLQAALDKVKKKNPTLRADAIVVRRAGNRVFLAGLNDESHYHAVVHLLNQWGCHWYLPTDIGEVIPTHPTLSVGTIDYAYAPPFEVRHYWISWVGSNAGAAEFQMRNFMSSQKVGGMGHALATYTADIAPAGKSPYNVPFAEPATAQHVANKIEPLYAKGEHSISLAIEDGAYENDSPIDKALQAGIRDKYFYDATGQRDSLTDPMMVFYNNVAKILREKHPQSKTLLGGMAYINVTIPPQRSFKPEPNLVMWLAPIDIDANHSMDDPKSPPKQEYREMVYRWSDVMEGRVVIYDYDQGMLVWRDLPNPSHYMFKTDIKHYAKAGILGIGTESRNAIASTFTNLYFRGQLMWNPDMNVDARLAEFYEGFYGPASKPMADYWNAIYAAWENTISTEHEHFAAPAIYTPQLVAQLKTHLAAAQAIVKPLVGKAGATRQEKQYVERMTAAQNSFNLIEAHRQMVTAAATEGDYKTALEAGTRGLAALLAVHKQNDTFTTPTPQGWYDGKTEVMKMGGDPAWWPGEVQQYADLLALTNGTKGTLIAKTPLEWAFRRDPNDSGLASGWAYKPVDLTYWNANKGKYNLETLKDYPTTQWEMIRTDLYAQAQGIRHPDQQSFTGHLWYRTEVDLTPAQLNGKVRLMFPGIFNPGWLYVNGHLMEYRHQNPMWWYNSYKFEWDADLTGKLKPGKNTITVRLANPHHFGGIFRRPFLYKPVG